MAKTPKNVDEFVSQKFKEYLKVYLVFRFKSYSWKKELQNEFSIADSIVNEGLKILEREGFLISKDFWSLDLDMQEIIRRLNGAYFDKIASFPKIYVLNQDDTKEAWWELYKEEIEALIRGDGSMTHTIDLIHQKKKAYKKLQEKFDFLENHKLERERIDWQTGITYHTQTKKAKTLLSELKSARLENKQTKQIENKKSNQIVIKQNNLTTKPEILRHYTLNGLEVSKSYFDEKEKELNEIISEDKIYEKELKKDEKIKHAIQETIKNFSQEKNLHFSKIPDLNQITGFGRFTKELDQEAIERAKMWDSFFNIQNENEKSFSFENNEEKKQAQKITKQLIEKLKEKGHLDFFYVQSICGSENIFKFFQESLKDLPVSFDGDDFIYEN